MGKKIRVYARLETDIAATGSLTLEWAQMLWESISLAERPRGSWLKDARAMEGRNQVWGWKVGGLYKTWSQNSWATGTHGADRYLLPQAQKFKNKKKEGISFSKETKWTPRRDEIQEAVELT